MTTQQKVEFLRATICEDVRAEKDGRFSLMGVISGEIVFSTDEPNPENPSMDLAFYIECQIYETAKISFRLMGPSSKTAAREITGELRKNPNGKACELAAVSLPRTLFEFSESGPHAFQAKCEQSRWKTLNVLHIDIDRDVVRADDPTLGSLN